MAASSLAPSEWAIPGLSTEAAVTRDRLSRVLMTVTWKVSVAVLPAASVAVQVTVVTPMAKVEPGAGLQLTVTGPGALSVAAGSRYVPTAPAGLVASSVASGGTPVKVGGISSTTVAAGPVTRIGIAASLLLH